MRSSKDTAFSIAFKDMANDKDRNEKKKSVPYFDKGRERKMVWGVVGGEHLLEDGFLLNKRLGVGLEKMNKENNYLNFRPINNQGGLIKINDTDYYQHKTMNRRRTKRRLKKMALLGIRELGFGAFGIKGVFSGLYIEKVWGLSNKDFNAYINWVKELKIKKQ